jgi:hypothetical protein
MSATAGLEYLHTELFAGPDDTIEVTLDHAANVQLLDPSNFEAYRQRRTYRFRGGYVTQSPYRIRPPHRGKWHVVVDLGGTAGSVRASVRVIHAGEASRSHST